MEWINNGIQHQINIFFAASLKLHKKICSSADLVTFTKDIFNENLIFYVV